MDMKIGGPELGGRFQSNYPAKGQLISKCLFGVFNSSKRQTKTIRPEVP
jgi:hypothetical protein